MKKTIKNCNCRLYLFLLCVSECGAHRAHQLYTCSGCQLFSTAAETILYRTAVKTINYLRTLLLGSTYQSIFAKKCLATQTLNPRIEYSWSLNGFNIFIFQFRSWKHSFFSPTSRNTETQTHNGKMNRGLFCSEFVAYHAACRMYCWHEFPFSVMPHHATQMYFPNAFYYRINEFLRCPILAGHDQVICCHARCYFNDSRDKKYKYRFYENVSD